jgi:hypothetical protein
LFNDMRYFKSSYLSVELFFSLFFLRFPAFNRLVLFETDSDLFHWCLIKIYSIGEYFFYNILWDCYFLISPFVRIFLENTFSPLIFFYCTGLISMSATTWLFYLGWVSGPMMYLGYGPDYFFYRGISLRLETGYDFLLAYDSPAVPYIALFVFSVLLLKYIIGVGYKLAIVGGLIILAFASAVAEVVFVVVVLHGLIVPYAYVSSIGEWLLLFDEDLETWR